MTPKIEMSGEKKLVGKHLHMSLNENRTGELWKSFMPRRGEIINKVSHDLISMQVYAPNYFSNFHPANQFEKWAAVEVVDFEVLPPGMDSYILKDGLYAMFDYKGLSNDPGVFQYIFKSWLPESNYSLDDRPHFEVLGPNYKNGNPDSEEEIWIPIKSTNS